MTEPTPAPGPTPRPAPTEAGEPTGETLVLGVDLGTGGVRTALATAGGRILAVARRDLATRLLPGGGAEQDPRDWWQAVTATVRELVEAHPDRKSVV